jgi:hypothetical protein
MNPIKVNLAPGFFSARERTLVEAGPLSASLFRFESGVAGVRLRSDRGQLVLLPFQGQQAWSAQFEGRDLTMKSMFHQPYPTQDFLHTFGGFLQHCGLTGAGGPSPQDSHPLHGELPNAPYQTAYVMAGQDSRGPYLGLGGIYEYTVAFAHHYRAEPLVKLYAGATNFQVSMTVTNLKNSPMELMYLAHVNFKPVDNSRLVYSAHCTPEHVRVRSAIPAHIKPGPGYVEFIQSLKAAPEKHNLLRPELAFDPEAVFFIDYLADETGWAYNLQVHPEGTADYIRHRPEQLPKGTRWLSRTPDQDAIALVEAGTCEPEGYLAEKAKGNLKILPAGGQFYGELEIGSLAPAEAAQWETKIQNLLNYT